MAEDKNTISFKVGQWQVFVDDNSLLCDEPPGAVAQIILPKVMTLLIYFIKNPNRLLTFDELNQAVWPTEVVGDNAIYNLVGQLRKVLGDKAASPRYIETLSKKGYRLIAPVQTHSSAATKDESVLTVKKGRSVWLIVTVILLIVSLAGYFWQRPTSINAMPPMAKQLYALAMFHQFKTEVKSKQKAIDYLRQTLAVIPDFLPGYHELGFAHLRLAMLRNNAKTLYLKKAAAVAKTANALDKNAIDSQVLTACLKFWQGDSNALEVLQAIFKTTKPISTSARLAYGHILFTQGKTNAAIEAQTMAVNHCPDCASAYHALAISQKVAQRLDEAFKNYNHYLELSAFDAADPVKVLGYSQLTFDKLKAMSQWYQQVPSPTSLSTGQRNTLALFYLAQDRIALAQKLMNEGNVQNDSDFYSLYTQAAVAGAQGDFATTLVFLSKRHQRYPDNNRFIFSMALAHWMAGQPSKAFLVLTTQVFNQPLTLPQKVADIDQPHHWLLYAALLIEQGKLEEGQSILRLLDEKSTSALSSGSGQMNMSRADILAMLGEKEQALDQIEMALKAGWVPDFNLDWWQLEDNPYFNGLRAEVRFKQLVVDHHLRIKQLLQAQ